MSAENWIYASAAYREALSLDPDDYMALIGLGWALYEEKNSLQDALSEFQKAIQLDPQRGDGYFHTGQLLFRENQYVEAESWYREAISRNQDVPWWHIAHANSVRLAGDIDRAIDLYSRAIVRFPEYPIAYYEISWAYRLDDNRPEALAAIQKAYDLGISREPWFFLRAGWISEWVGDKDRAFDYFEQVLQLDPGNDLAQEAIARLNTP
jgi:Tfp pilus assembly protein PilF